MDGLLPDGPAYIVSGWLFLCGLGLVCTAAADGVLADVYILSLLVQVMAAFRLANPYSLFV